MQRGLLDIGFGRFDIIEARDRQTDGLRDRHPATAHTHNTRIAYASRLKNLCRTCSVHFSHFWATVYKTVRIILSGPLSVCPVLSVQSVTLVYCG